MAMEPLPGNAFLHSAAIIGTTLMLLSFLYTFTKRTLTLSNLKPLWVSLHIIFASLGASLIFIHSSGHLLKPPVFILLALSGSLLTGIVGRIITSRYAHLYFSRNPHPYILPAPADKTNFEKILTEKANLLKSFEPNADEAQFTMSLTHWLRHPHTALKYQLQTWREEALILKNAAAPTDWRSSLLRYWRLLHILSSILLVFGSLIHIIVTSLFADYVAAGREVYWWHIRR